MSREKDVRKQDYTDLQNMVNSECEYPGQTLMVALAITLEFSSLGDAQKKASSDPSSHASCNLAERSSMIPGATCAVQTAIDILSVGVRDDLDCDSMVSRLHEAWFKYVSGSTFKGQYKIGLAKAQPFEKFFRQHWGIWKNISIEDAKLESSCEI